MEMAAGMEESGNGSGSGRARSALAVCMALATAACLFETATPVPGDELRLDYTVTAPDLPPVSISGAPVACRVDIRIHAWPQGRRKIFQAPVFYSDNPVMPVRGIKAGELTATDRRGNPVTARDTVLPGPALDGNFIVLGDSAFSISYGVDLDPKDPQRFGIPMPGVGKGVDMIDGAYFFVLPLLGDDFPSQWRATGRFNLEFRAAAGRELVGTDAKRALSTNYEMMFLRAAWNPIKSKTFTMRNHEVTLYATSSADIDLDRFGPLFESYIRLVEDSLMPLPTYRYFAGENPQFWGIEGIQGYWFKEEAMDLPVVHMHELAHTFVGVYHGEYDDPWWKEGVTDYLGLLLSIQAGLIGDTAFAAEILNSYDNLPSVKAHALSSAFLRNHLFAPLDSAYAHPFDPENYVGLIYGKGGQAAMILDRYLLEKSGGKASIYDLIRALTRSHGSAFRRSDLVSETDRLAGGSSAVFLGDLLDRASPLGADSLANTYKVLRTLGRFGPGGGKLPVAGIDGALISGGAAKTATGVPQGSKL
jgi:hypothetical protein